MEPESQLDGELDRGDGGLIHIAGAFGTVAGVPRTYLAAIEAGTGIIKPWNPNPNSLVRTLVLQGGLFYAGGSFTQIGGQARNGIAALDVVTGAATAWNPNVNGTVTHIVPNGSTIYFGGPFTGVGGQYRLYYAGVSATTGNLTWYPSTSGGAPLNMAWALGALYAGTGFGSWTYRLRAYDLVTASLTSWNPQPGGPVEALAVSGGTLYAGGSFGVMGGRVRSCLAAIDFLSTGEATDWDPEPRQFDSRSRYRWGQSLRGRVLRSGRRSDTAPHGGRT